MRRVILHVVNPALLTALFFAIALTPVHVLGCRTRGLLALLVASASAIMALTVAILARKRHSTGDAQAVWWILSVLILIIPVVALLVMA